MPSRRSQAVPTGPAHGRSRHPGSPLSSQSMIKGSQSSSAPSLASSQVSCAISSSMKSIRRSPSQEVATTPPRLLPVASRPVRQPVQERPHLTVGLTPEVQVQLGSAAVSRHGEEWRREQLSHECRRVCPVFPDKGSRAVSDDVVQIRELENPASRVIGRQPNGVRERSAVCDLHEVAVAGG
jgi:hypothetical protein